MLPQMMPLPWVFVFFLVFFLFFLLTTFFTLFIFPYSVLNKSSLYFKFYYFCW